MGIANDHPTFMLVVLIGWFEYDVAVKEDKSDSFGQFWFFEVRIELATSLHLLAGCWVDIAK